MWGLSSKWNQETDKHRFLSPHDRVYSSSRPYDKELEALVSKKLEKDGMVGMAVAGGAALAVGGQDLSDYVEL